MDMEIQDEWDEPEEDIPEIPEDIRPKLSEEEKKLRHQIYVN